ncbi:MAG: hypothetical protein AAB217_00110 [Chloroflexota bacterium]
MLKFVRNIGLTALVAAVTVLGISALALIRPAAAADSQASAVVAHGGGRGLCGQAGLEAAAEALGMTADELSTQLWGGESLANLADEAGVDLQDVQDAVTAACQTATRDAIEQAVTDGSLTREHADWLLEGLDKGYWGGNSGGFGFGPRGFGGHGRFGQSPFNNTVPSTSTPGSDS